MEFEKITKFIKNLYDNKDFVPLHEPVFNGNEKEYLNKCIDSTFVSSVGEYVNLFEKRIAEFTGAAYAVATVNGTSALHISLLISGVKPGDEVITQSVSFVATVNAISYCGATPYFVDIDKNTLSLSPEKLRKFLEENCKVEGEICINKKTGKKISACVPMHTFGQPAEMDELLKICSEYNIVVVEDAAESLGSYYGSQHTGTLGKVGIFSFNGNKIITTGGGGMIVTNDEKLAKLAKHLTTTAKLPHKYEYVHDQIGYNYRLPNLNAALGVAQLEQLEDFLENKRNLSKLYSDFFSEIGIKFIEERKGTKSNYWLNAIILNNREERDRFLEYTNNNGIMTRPLWRPLHLLPMFKDSPREELYETEWLYDRIVNIPSGVRKGGK